MYVNGLWGKKSVVGHLSVKTPSCVSRQVYTMSSSKKTSSCSSALIPISPSCGSSAMHKIIQMQIQLQLRLMSNTKMSTMCDFCDFHHKRSETAELLGFLHTTVSIGYSVWCRLRHFVDERDHLQG